MLLCDEVPAPHMCGLRSEPDGDMPLRASRTLHATHRGEPAVRPSATPRRQPNSSGFKHEPASSTACAAVVLFGVAYYWMPSRTANSAIASSFNAPLHDVAKRATASFRDGKVMHVENEFAGEQTLTELRDAAAQVNKAHGVAAPVYQVDGGAENDNSWRNSSMVELLPLQREQRLPRALETIQELMSSLCEALNDEGQPRPLVGCTLSTVLLTYPKGGFYKAHFDEEAQIQIDMGRIRESNAPPLRRELSVVLFLSPSGWTAKAGGQLRFLRDPSSSVQSTSDSLVPLDDVLPKGGTLVLFKSMTPHQVLRTRRAGRICICGWFHSERAHARINGG